MGEGRLTRQSRDDEAVGSRTTPGVLLSFRADGGDGSVCNYGGISTTRTYALAGACAKVLGEVAASLIERGADVTAVYRINGTNALFWA